MKRTFSLAVACGLLAHTSYAGAFHGGGFAGFHMAAPVARTSSVAVPRSFAQPLPSRVASVPRFTSNGAPGFAIRSTRSAATFSPTIRTPQSTYRSFAGVPRSTWSPRQFAGIPFSVHHDWDRHRDHEWNHHHFRFVGNSWVLLDPYPYYSYSYSYPSSYFDNDDVDTAYAPAPEQADAADLEAEVQEALARAGYYQGAIDGEVGPVTRNAIASYQRAHRLAVTGTITRALLDSLGVE